MTTMTIIYFDDDSNTVLIYLLSAKDMQEIHTFNHVRLLFIVRGRHRQVSRITKCHHFLLQLRTEAEPNDKHF
jgi:hypothetical protein